MWNIVEQLISIWKEPRRYIWLWWFADACHYVKERGREREWEKGTPKITGNGKSTDQAFPDKACDVAQQLARWFHENSAEFEKLGWWHFVCMWWWRWQRFSMPWQGLRLFETHLQDHATTQRNKSIMYFYVLLAGGCVVMQRFGRSCGHCWICALWCRHIFLRTMLIKGWSLTSLQGCCRWRTLQMLWCSYSPCWCNTKMSSR